jgi:hypothetical protein
MIEGLKSRGAARAFAGRIEHFHYEPIDASGEIAAEIWRRFFRARAAV